MHVHHIICFVLKKFDRELKSKMGDEEPLRKKQRSI